MASKTIERPLDMIRLSLDERVVVKLKGSRELRGKLFVRLCCRARAFTSGAPSIPVSTFCRIDSSPPSARHSPRQAFDEHVNMVLGDCEETHTSEELDAETGEIMIKRDVRSLGMLFVRGDTVIFISPR